MSAGQPLLTLEAMKMESRVPSPVDGIVDRVLTPPGTQVDAGTPLIILTPDAT